MAAPKLDPLFADEAEIARRLGITSAEWTATAIVAA